ncbi:MULTISPECIES: DNA starvation/stationary phase protection protein Dps [unclassified Psychrobacter]|uniref:DNA starvation/stationary phase protection protein Dps n=1 Tax=unclassified Psychrobacter TaxID=196806 RepID=UPI00071E7347|nr:MULTISPECIES: DNA starvation/stationary phase protection protein Dps [unclassified Psychrobacter]OLF39248.1 DNA starvation/stationary phase protection protein Dps [Psychrobacter sp. Cmf 22.2]
MRERYASGITDETAEKMVDLLNSNLANLIDLSMDSKQCHWNLQGTGFIGVHQLLDDTYERLTEAYDTVAERIVILGGKANGISKRVVEDSVLETYPTDITEVDQHVRELTNRYKTIAEELRKAIDSAGEAGDEDTADLFTEVSRIIDKDAWFIGANAPKK